MSGKNTLYPWPRTFDDNHFDGNQSARSFLEAVKMPLAEAAQRINPQRWRIPRLFLNPNP